MKRNLCLAVLAIAASVLAGGRAQASYSYSTSITVQSVSPLPGDTVTIVNTPGVGSVVTIATPTGVTTVTFGDESRTGFAVPSINTINVGDVSVTTTEPPNGAGLTAVPGINYTDAITLINTPPPGTPATSVPLDFTGSLALNSVDTGNGTVGNTFTSATSGQIVVGGVTFIGGITNFAFPTINGTGGNIGGTIAAVTVPEPASMVMLGMGLVGTCVLSRRVRKRPVTA